MFVHGRWSGIRLSNFILLFFYKNIIFTMPQFYFGFYNGYSGQTFWDDGYIMMFNTIITAFGIGGYAVWEQDIDLQDPDKRPLIETFFPYLYKTT